MMQRVWVLTQFLTRRFFFSLTGLLYILVALVYWIVLFPPQQSTPDMDNYFLIIGAFGAAMAFLVTLTIASRANEAANYPLVVRLPSRVEMLTAVLLSALLAAGLLQLLVAALALLRGPSLLDGRFLEIPPVWIAVNVLSAVLAMHASDFVASGWSRVVVFGLLAVFLFGQGNSGSLGPWLANQLSRLSVTFLTQGWTGLAGTLNRLVNWLGAADGGRLGNLLGFVFWPFRAVSDAVITGYFDTNQALAPAVMLLYATILFMLAADLFANKDLDFIE
ncbi:MAG: hypothetical protein KC425_21440 [Anaerolineales bacterium]|nr:hypothetical protein [Anaerolineales bacterium]